MRLRHIEVFHAVYTSGTMTNAAALLGVSQPSISKVLAHAEQQLGYPLFDRVRGKLVPTPEAHRLIRHVETVYRNIDTLKQVAGNLRSAESGRIRIGVTPAIASDVLPSAIADFQFAHPEVNFEIRTAHRDQIIEMLRQSRLDIGVAFDAGANVDIASQVLSSGEIVVLAPPGFSFGSDEVSLMDLEGSRFIALSTDGPLGARLEPHIKDAGIVLDVVAVTETYQVARSLVARGVGVTLADELTASAMSPDNVEVFRLKPAIVFNVSAMHLDTVPLSVSSAKFIQTLKHHLKQCL